MFLLAIVGAVAPALWLIKYFTESDQFPEPPEVIRSTFWGGVKSTMWVLLFVSPTFLFDESVAKLPVVVSSAYSAFLCAAIPEEFFKFRVLQKVSKDAAFDEPMDGIVYGAVASLGFATLENILYCMNGDIGTIVGRAITAVPAHASFGAIMGYYYSKAHFNGQKVGVFSTAYFLPMMLHGIYDYVLFVMVGLGEKEQSTESEEMLMVACLVAFVMLWRWMFKTVTGMVKELKQEQLALIRARKTESS